jgi:hypothetical protein
MCNPFTRCIIVYCMAKLDDLLGDLFYFCLNDQSALDGYSCKGHLVGKSNTTNPSRTSQKNMMAAIAAMAVWTLEFAQGLQL